MLEHTFVGVGLSIRIESGAPGNGIRSVFGSGIVMLSQGIGRKAVCALKVTSYKSETQQKSRHKILTALIHGSGGGASIRSGGRRTGTGTRLICVVVRHDIETLLQKTVGRRT